MELGEILKEVNIIQELKAADKRGVLEELAGTISDHEPSIEKENLVKVLIERERLGSTGIGDGVAIPHGKLGNTKYPIISFGRSKEGLDFDSMDGQPAHIFFLLIAPEDSSSIHLQVLARIAKILKSVTFRKGLMAAATRTDLYQAIIRMDRES